ncbi:proto-oncogene tyrosine-protein kinase receptor Ret-like [Stegodyphus dumicola]|uniref:proto-oncogene tyrosine-protein kinase receptor Ret-like n=1 Tax=Stegodyphus dumicola TaxID=202533 RepID=UPI0015AB5CDC|nr:proto-oncogene tyrosine-protein kinase receptor Ret-like [Stegodyphus dumicola]
MTFLNAEIRSQGVFAFPGSEYNFSVIIEDAKLLKNKNKVTYFISIVNKTEPEINLKEDYKIIIPKTAAQYARVLQLTKYASSTHRFQFADGEKENDWLGMTEKSGIVFIKNSSLLANATAEKRKVIWWSKNDTHERSGNLLLLLEIENKDFLPKACNKDAWCSLYASQSECESSCGKGSKIGFCLWRTSSLTSIRPSPDYATCSPDFSTCPDGYCDELEQLEKTLCPQDCVESFDGITVSKTSTGLKKAVGPCSCSTPERCTCTSFYPPAEMRRPKNRTPPRISTPPSIIEIEKVTLIDTGKFVVHTEDETSTSVELAPFAGLLTNGTCGAGCIALVSIAPCGLVLIILILIVTRKMRSNQMSKHKFVGSHISLSAVPSDYVDERSNSAQDSRNTPSESSGSAKAFLDSKWEFPRNRLQFLTVLGEGEFGKVMKAQAWNIAGIKGYTTVAVKMLKENGGPLEKQDLMTEFMLLKEISHPNVVRLLGASTEKSGPFYLIVEYAEMGSLRSYLRKRRRHNNCCRYNATYGVISQVADPSRDYYQFPCERSRYEPHHSYFHKEQLSFAWQIAKGMAYLADMKLVHRDLAARNVLLAKRKVAKISDFGLSRDVYEGETYLKKSKGRVPVKWMAIESLEDQIYTSKSDVWSFGIVMWEIMMQGATPYPGVTPQRLYNLLKAGYRMSKPDSCSDEVYHLMRQCWRDVPHERPSFKELVLKLDFLLQDTVEYMDFSVSSALSQASRSSDAQATNTVMNIQYTSVLVNDDEDQLPEESRETDPEEFQESIGLVNLFAQSQNALINSNESVA